MVPAAASARVLFAAHTALADNLGLRYIIPVLPFAYLIGGAGAAWLLQRGTLPQRERHHRLFPRASSSSSSRPPGSTSTWQAAICSSVAP